MRSVSGLQSRRLALKIIFSALILMGGLQALCIALAGMLFVNISPSIPVGLYLRDQHLALQVGDAVVVRVNDKVRDVALKVGLLEHTKFLFKRVLALPGERFCFEAGALQVRERKWKLQKETSRGAALPQGRGCFELSDHEQLLIGDTVDSFDSRYFGPIPAADVITKVRPIFTF